MRWVVCLLEDREASDSQFIVEREREEKLRHSCPTQRPSSANTVSDDNINVSDRRLSGISLIKMARAMWDAVRICSVRSGLDVTRPIDCRDQRVPWINTPFAEPASAH